MSNYRYLFLISFTIISLPVLAMQPTPFFMNVLKSEIEKGALLDLGEHQKGKGSFGDVHVGTFLGSEVAIKTFHLKSLPNHLAGEFDIYTRLSHPNLVRFYGVCDQPGKFSMIMELMPFSLCKFYNENLLSWDNIFNFAEQIAKGLLFIHSRNFSHKHLKSNNIFVTNDLIIKISDFGLSKIKLESSSNGAAGGEATVRWRAPETFTREYSKVKDTLEAQKAADTYSYGVVVWEMKTRKKPFETHTESSVVQLLGVATREEIDAKWPQHFKTLLNDCWRFVPSERPTMLKVLETLSKQEFNIEVARKAIVEGFNKEMDTCSKNKYTTEISSLNKKISDDDNKRIEITNERDRLRTENNARKSDVISLCRVLKLSDVIKGDRVEGEKSLISEAKKIMKENDELRSQVVSFQTCMQTKAQEPLDTEALFENFPKERSASEYEILAMELESANLKNDRLTEACQLLECQLHAQKAEFDELVAKFAKANVDDSTSEDD